MSCQKPIYFLYGVTRWYVVPCTLSPKKYWGIMFILYYKHYVSTPTTPRAETYKGWKPLCPPDEAWADTFLKDDFIVVLIMIYHGFSTKRLSQKLHKWTWCWMLVNWCVFYLRVNIIRPILMKSPLIHWLTNYQGTCWTKYHAVYRDIASKSWSADLFVNPISVQI